MRVLQKDDTTVGNELSMDDGDEDDDEKNG